MKELAINMLPFKEKIGKAIVSKYIDKPIFVVGCGRSGTTALGNAIGMHPNIRSTAIEAPLINHFAGVFQHYCCCDVADYVQNATQIRGDELRERIKKDMYEVVWGEYYGLRSAIREYLQSFGNQIYDRWLVKAFPNEREWDGLRGLFPEAKFVYIYRNGIDVVNSMTKFGWFSKQSFKKLCEFWVRHMNRYSYLEDGGRAVVIRYEHFLNDPEAVLKKIYGYMDYEMENGSLEYAQTRIVHPLDKPDINGSPKDIITKRQPAYLSWSNEQKNVFKKVAGEMMERYQYDMPY